MGFRENLKDELKYQDIRVKELGVTVEYLVTGKTAEIPDNIKPEVISLIRDINHLSEKDIDFVKEMAKRLIISAKKT